MGLKQNSLKIVADKLEEKFLHLVQTGSGVHPAYTQWASGDLSPRVRRPGREADLSSPCSAEIDDARSCNFTARYRYASMAFVETSVPLLVTL
jgi:hypothetical protein